MTPSAERRLSDALHDIAATQPFVPDADAIERRSRRLRQRMATVRIAGAAVAVVAVATAATVVLNTVGSSHPPTITATHRVTARQSLAHLIASLPTAPKVTGDATLSVEDVGTLSNGQQGQNWELDVDDNTFYSGSSHAELHAQVAGHHKQVDTSFVREVAAAKYAATGDLATARDQMADAQVKPSDPNKVSTSNDIGEIGTEIWQNGWFALTTDAGDAVVRMGVLRLLSTLPEVVITDTTTAGRRTITLTYPNLGSDRDPPNSLRTTHILVIDAATGVPVATHREELDGGSPVSSVDFEFSRVTVADVAAGKF
jgi:hypothetical protein